MSVLGFPRKRETSLIVAGVYLSADVVEKIHSFVDLPPLLQIPGFIELLFPRLRTYVKNESWKISRPVLSRLPPLLVGVIPYSRMPIWPKINVLIEVWEEPPQSQGCIIRLSAEGVPTPVINVRVSFRRDTLRYTDTVAEYWYEYIVSPTTSRLYTAIYLAAEEARGFLNKAVSRGRGPLIMLGENEFGPSDAVGTDT